MYNIILLGDDNDRHITHCLLALLKADYQVNQITTDISQTIGDGAPINLIELTEISEVAMNNGILILKQNAKTSALKRIDPSVKVILSESDVKSISPFASSLSNVYTCGFSPKECVTFSSREEEDMVVSLQRSILLPSGITCEPFEIPCHRSVGYSDYAMLASVLTMILIGALNENKTKEIGKIYFS